MLHGLPPRRACISSRSRRPGSSAGLPGCQDPACGLVGAARDLALHHGPVAQHLQAAGPRGSASPPGPVCRKRAGTAKRRRQTQHRPALWPCCNLWLRSAHRAARHRPVPAGAGGEDAGIQLAAHALLAAPRRPGSQHTQAVGACWHALVSNICCMLLRTLVTCLSPSQQARHQCGTTTATACVHACMNCPAGSPNDTSVVLALELRVAVALGEVALCVERRGTARGGMLTGWRVGQR